jgi:hypothetical protein
VSASCISSVRAQLLVAVMLTSSLAIDNSLHRVTTSAILSSQLKDIKVTSAKCHSIVKDLLDPGFFNSSLHMMESQGFAR